MPWGSLATISSMACIASPELLPGAGSPKKFSAGKLLYLSRRGESYTHRPEAKALKGTIPPLAFRT